MHTKSKLTSLFFVICYSQFSAVHAEQLLQQQKMDFSTCLTVIEESEKNLSITPEVTIKEKLFREADFILEDGVVTIKCDGEEGTLTVISK